MAEGCPLGVSWRRPAWLPPGRGWAEAVQELGAQQLGVWLSLGPASRACRRGCSGAWDLPSPQDSLGPEQGLH